MVSINKNFNTSQPGATFFNSSTDEDGRLVNQASNQPHHFEPLHTIPFSTIHIIVSTIISIVGIVLAVEEPDTKHKCRSYFIMLYLHAAFWFFTLVIDYILKKTHHSLRVRGYLEFYQKTYTLHRAPIYMVSLWNAFLLLIQTVSQHCYPDNFTDQCVKPGLATPIAYITGFIWLETLLLAITHGQYIKKVSDFNKCQHRPDVQRDHLVEAPGGTSGTSQAPAPLSQTLTQTADLLARQNFITHGHRHVHISRPEHKGEGVDNNYNGAQSGKMALEADLIRHLREHNEKLSNKLSTTTTQLRTLQHQQSGDKAAAS